MKSRLHFLFLLLTTLLPLGTYARPASDEIDFFARIQPDPEVVYAGDSCVVSVVLYAKLPFKSVETTPDQLRIHGGHHRLLPQRERTQTQVRLDRGIYYSTVWARFLVGRDEIGKMRFDRLRLNARFSVMEAVASPFADFFGPEWREKEIRQASCHLPALILSFQKPPQRTTRDILQSGGVIV